MPGNRGGLAAVAVLVLALVPVPAAAEENICLRSSNIYTWDAVDDRTLIVTDRQRKQYKVDLVGVCSGLEQVTLALGFVTQSELSCVRAGNSIRFNDPAFGAQRCVVTKIGSYTPPPPEAEEED